MRIQKLKLLQYVRDIDDERRADSPTFAPSQTLQGSNSDSSMTKDAPETSSPAESSKESRQGSASGSWFIDPNNVEAASQNNKPRQATVRMTIYQMRKLLQSQ